MQRTFWDDRFESETYVYGESPNMFLKSSLDVLEPGKILFPGEGEGRNAVYAAQNNWDVLAFDSSTEGKKKALSLAGSRNTSINYELSSYLDFDTEERFDAIGLFFTHMPMDMRSIVHSKYIELLKPGGQLILQGFRKEQLGLNSGGPKVLDMLFSNDELESDFNKLQSININEVDETLSEGPFHQGLARLITLIGIK